MMRLIDATHGEARTHFLKGSSYRILSNHRFIEPLTCYLDRPFSSPSAPSAHHYERRRALNSAPFQSLQPKVYIIHHLAQSNQDIHQDQIRGCLTANLNRIRKWRWSIRICISNPADVRLVYQNPTTSVPFHIHLDTVT